MDSTAPTPVLLVVDDEHEHVASLRRVFERDSLVVHGATSGELALQRLRDTPVDLVLADVMMPGMSGIDLLRATRTLRPDADVVVMTAYGTIELAVEAMRAGAYDFVEKPFKAALIRRVVARALERQRLTKENVLLRAQLDAARNGGRERVLVGRAPAMQATMEMVAQAAASSATVFVNGESGTGKELIARALHDQSPRRDGPFVVVNCAALPESILEAELFGFERGAFTGATATKEGRIERAEAGTLFLDEVAELAQPVQAKLLRVLQEGEFERLGGHETRRVDFRLVSATNRDLEQLVRQGTFREDLFYRLNVIGIQLPPLRDRPEDIPLLVDHFLRRFADKNDKPIRGIEKETMDALRRWPWPGNVRELENVIERAVVLSRGPAIGLDDLPQPLRNNPSVTDHGPVRREGRSVVVPIGTKLEEVERALIHATLVETSGDKTLAAQLLGIAPRTIYRRLEAERSPKD